MIVLTVLALAVVAEGYRLDSPPPSPMGVNMMKKMCLQNGANYTAVENAAVQFVNCIEVDFEVKMFESELKEAFMYHSYSAFNRVFQKYCRKTPEIKACYHKLVDAVAPCFGDGKQDLATISVNMNDQILDYVCENDGYIMTKFVMEGGPQCFQEKTYDIMMCTEMSKSSVLNMEQSSSLSVTENFRVYDNLLKCILQSVETCNSSISTRIVKRVGEIVKQSILKEVNNATARVSTERVWHESTTPRTNDNSTKQYFYRPTTSTERYLYSPTTERYLYRPTTERYLYRPTTSTERYLYSPTTERYLYRPTTERYLYRPTTEQYLYRPTTSTERYLYSPTTEPYLYRPTTTTERVWHKPTITTEQVGNHVNTAWQNEKGAPTDGSYNTQIQFGHIGTHNNIDQDTKNIACNPLKRLFKASGTFNVAFNADINI
ncbi:unnamed protein product [Arctia plantaginis]|uniref:Uncharacterized protein n=1 Tax=Arctia plantaginis TaxID=874455 RepID=A0A8S1A490_ARCPL|nr:unnamed protein product [Arctia plantaginis]